MRETSKVMEHPVETGVVLSDHHIINPVEIDLPLMVPAIYYAAIYQQIKADFLAATELSVKTPVNVYGSMIIADMPHEESPEHFNAIIIGLRLKQVLFEVPGSTQPLPANYSPAEPGDQNTVQSGLQSASTLGTQAAGRCDVAIASYARLSGKDSEYVPVAHPILPNQEFQAILDGNSWDFTIRSTNGVMSITLVLNGSTVIENIAVRGRVVRHPFASTRNPATSCSSPPITSCPTIPSSVPRRASST